MNAADLIRAGDFDGALASLMQSVRASPTDPKLRIFLFQLLCIQGDWKRAVTQLKLCAELDRDAETMARTYREAIICEVYRERVFAGEKVPLVFGAPQEWTAMLVEAVRLLATGRPEDAAVLRARAFDAAPEVPGEINGERFSWIADADMRLGPLLEIIVNGKYFWMPFSAISVLRLDPPADLRDAVWMPASLTLQNGGEFVALLPTRYVGTAASNDASLRLARATSWLDAGGDTWIGSGQRLLTTDAADVALMDLRTLRIDAQAVDRASNG